MTVHHSLTAARLALFVPDESLLLPKRPLTNSAMAAAMMLQCCHPPGWPALPRSRASRARAAAAAAAGAFPIEAACCVNKAVIGLNPQGYRGLLAAADIAPGDVVLRIPLANMLQVPRRLTQPGMQQAASSALHTWQQQHSWQLPAQLVSFLASTDAVWEAKLVAWLLYLRAAAPKGSLWASYCRSLPSAVEAITFCSYSEQQAEQLQLSTWKVCLDPSPAGCWLHVHSRGSGMNQQPAKLQMSEFCYRQTGRCCSDLWQGGCSLNNRACVPACLPLPACLPACLQNLADKQRQLLDTVQQQCESAGLQQLLTPPPTNGSSSSSTNDPDYTWALSMIKSRTFGQKLPASGVRSNSTAGQAAAAPGAQPPPSRPPAAAASAAAAAAPAAAVASAAAAAAAQELEEDDSGVFLLMAPFIDMINHAPDNNCVFGIDPDASRYVDVEGLTGPGRRWGP